MDGRLLYDFFTLEEAKRVKAFEQVIKDNFRFNNSHNFNLLSRNLSQIVGINLKTTRKLRGFKTSSALAKRLNILPSKLNAWETGKANVPSHEVARWNILFSVHPYLLLKGSAYEPLIKLDVISDNKSLKLQIGLSKLGFSCYEKLAKYALKHAEPTKKIPMCHLSLLEKRLENHSELDIEEEVLERFYTSYGTNLKSLRQCTGLSQRRLSEALFIGEERYRRLEKAQNTPKFEHDLILRMQLVSNIIPVILMHDTLYGEYCVRFLSRYSYIKRLCLTDEMMIDLMHMTEDLIANQAKCNKPGLSPGSHNNSGLTSSKINGFYVF